MTARSNIDGRDVIFKDNIWVFEDTGEGVPTDKCPKPNVFRPKYRELTDEEKLQLNMVKEMAGSLYDVIEANVPEGRYKALAKTELEASIMWAVKGITE